MMRTAVEKTRVQGPALMRRRTVADDGDEGPALAELTALAADPGLWVAAVHAAGATPVVEQTVLNN